ncbi:MAG: helix-turn-helix domain-containing protein [Burkholderiaceae bacterium]|nr:MAG: helix-turn-helix domain-containing protein [Burkholderiaceae bacterium]
MNHMERAISIVGNMTKLAEVLGVTPQAVKFWRDGERRIPAGICPSIERATERAVICEQLRPEVDWAYVRSGAGLIGGADAQSHEAAAHA